jgi:hypothetical protein
MYPKRIQRIIPDNPSTTNPNPNPSASPGTIDALPMVVFRQVSDEFNQTEWSVKIRIKYFSMIIFHFIFL